MDQLGGIGNSMQSMQSMPSMQSVQQNTSLESGSQIAGLQGGQEMSALEGKVPAETVEKSNELNEEGACQKGCEGQNCEQKEAIEELKKQMEELMKSLSASQNQGCQGNQGSQDSGGNQGGGDQGVQGVNGAQNASPINNAANQKQDWDSKLQEDVKNVLAEKAGGAAGGAMAQQAGAAGANAAGAAGGAAGAATNAIGALSGANSSSGASGGSAMEQLKNDWQKCRDEGGQVSDQTKQLVEQTLAMEGVTGPGQNGGQEQGALAGMGGMAQQAMGAVQNLFG